VDHNVSDQANEQRLDAIDDDEDRGGELEKEGNIPSLKKSKRFVTDVLQSQSVQDKLDKIIQYMIQSKSKLTYFYLNSLGN
jgi:hypothetical protein